LKEATCKEQRPAIKVPSLATVLIGRRSCLTARPAVRCNAPRELSHSNG